MPRRQISYRKLRKVSVGDMRECISLENRAIQAPSFDSVGFSQKYAQIIETWAKVETQFNNRIFDEVALDAVPSHKFTIRYRSDVTTETRIGYKGNIYEIVQADDYEMRNEYLELYAKIEGDEDREVSR